MQSYTYLCNYTRIKEYYCKKTCISGYKPNILAEKIKRSGQEPLTLTPAEQKKSVPDPPAHSHY